MTPARKRRLATILFVLFGMSGAVALLLTALGSNMNHYYELSAIESGEAPLGKVIRVGGLVDKGSITREPETLKVAFSITDFQRHLNVRYEGIVPDLFREGQGVLAKGILVNRHQFVAQEILAKHDENYMPKEVQEQLENSGWYKHAEKRLPTTQ